MKNHITGLVAIIVVALQFIVDNIYKFLTQSRVLGTTRTGMLSSTETPDRLEEKHGCVPPVTQGFAAHARIRGGEKW